MNIVFNSILKYHCFTCKNDFQVEVLKMPKDYSEIETIGYYKLYCYCPYCGNKNVATKIIKDDKEFWGNYYVKL